MTLRLKLAGSQAISAAKSRRRQCAEFSIMLSMVVNCLVGVRECFRRFCTCPYLDAIATVRRSKGRGSRKAARRKPWVLKVRQCAGTAWKELGIIEFLTT